MDDKCTHSGCCSFTLLLGRLCLSAIFILAGIGKFMAFEETATYMAKAGLPAIPFLLYTAALVETLGGLALLIGWHTRLASFILLLFVMAASYLFHNFWALDDVAAKLEMISFMKNLAIAGGLLYLIGAGPGKLSIDHITCKS